MLKKLLIFVPVIALTVAVAGAPAVGAATCSSPAECAQAGVNTADTGSKTNDVGEVIQGIVNVLLFLVGAVSVIMIVIGGFKYVVSNGDSTQVKSAKDTIFYAVIGLIVAILGYALVSWVIATFVG